MAELATLEAPPKQESEKPPVDPELAQVLRDLGQLVDEDKPPEKKILPPSLPSMTLGETVMLAEQKRKEEEDADKAKPANDDSVPEEEGDPEAQPPPAKTQPAEKPAEPPAPKVEVKTKEGSDKELQSLIDNRLKDAMAKMPAPAPAPVKEPPKLELKADEDEYESKLGEIEQEELRFAKFAAQKDPNLKEYPKQFIDYLKKAEAYAEKARKDDPDRTFDERDEDWNKWQRENKPKFSPVLRRKLEREQFMEEAEAKADTKLRTEMAKVERRQELLEKRPVIDKIKEEFASGLSELMQAAPEGEESLVAPIAKRAKEVGWNKVLEEDPLFAPIVQRVTHTANKLAGEYLALVNKTVEFDANNGDHVWISDFITNQGKDFATKGGEATIKEGRQFLPRAEFFNVASMDPAKAAQFWTWSDTDILNRIAVNAKKNAANMIKIENDKLVRAGFERRKPEPVKRDFPKTEKTVTEQPKGSGSPKAPSSAAPGIAQPGKANAPASVFTEDELKIMVPGMPI